MSKLVWEKNSAGKMIQVPYSQSQRARRDAEAWKGVNEAFAESLLADSGLIRILGKAGVQVRK